MNNETLQLLKYLDLLNPQGRSKKCLSSFSNLTRAQLCLFQEFFSKMPFSQNPFNHNMIQQLKPQVKSFLSLGYFKYSPELKIMRQYLILIFKLSKRDELSRQILFQAPLKQIKSQSLKEEFILQKTCFCLGPRFILNTPIRTYEDKQQQPVPFIISKYSQLMKEGIKKQVCALANEGLGCIILANNFNGVEIKDGLTVFTPSDIQILQQQIQKAKKGIFNSSLIKVKVELVPLFSKFEILMDERTQKRSCIRILIKVEKSKFTQGFFYTFQYVKNKKPIYDFFVLRRQGTQLFKVQSLIEEAIYQEMMKKKHGLNTNRKLNRISCFQIGGSISFNQSSLLLERDSYNFQGATLFSICQKNFCSNEFQKYFPSLKPNFNSIVIALIKFDDKNIQLSRHFQVLFDNNKIKYKFFFPFPQFQKKILTLRKMNNSNNIDMNYVSFYSFEGDHKFFDKQWKKMQKKSQSYSSINVDFLLQTLIISSTLNICGSLINEMKKLGNYSSYQLSNNLNQATLKIMLSSSELNMGMYLTTLCILSQLSYETK